jgi:hypothetical protein
VAVARVVPTWVGMDGKLILAACIGVCAFVLVKSHGCHVGTTDGRATHLQQSGYRVQIPAGWRDLHEIEDRSFLHGVEVPDGTQFAFPEPYRSGDVLSLIVVSKRTTTPCAVIRAGAPAQKDKTGEIGELTELTRNGDPVCKVPLPDKHGVYYAVAHGDDMAMVMCLGNAEPMCAGLLETLEVP